MHQTADSSGDVGCGSCIHLKLDFGVWSSTNLVGNYRNWSVTCRRLIGTLSVCDANGDVIGETE